MKCSAVYRPGAGGSDRCRWERPLLSPPPGRLPSLEGPVGTRLPPLLPWTSVSAGAADGIVAHALRRTPPHPRKYAVIVRSSFSLFTQAPIPHATFPSPPHPRRRTLHAQPFIPPNDSNLACADVIAVELVDLLKAATTSRRNRPVNVLSTPARVRRSAAASTLSPSTASRVLAPSTSPTAASRYPLRPPRSGRPRVRINAPATPRGIIPVEKGLTEARECGTAREALHETHSIRLGIVGTRGEMAAYEKREVGLEERHKHANSKAEKLKRSLQEDENARNDALRSIQENTAKTKSEKREVDQYEEELQWEERALEGIRDGLEDKTEVFRDRIEQKQKELQPWKTKVDQKQAEVDVKTSERDMLVKTAEALEQASTEAHEALAKVKSVQTVKMGELENLRNRELSLQRVQDLTIRVNEHRAQASSTRQRVEEANASQAASASANEVSDSLMRLRDSGRVSGLHGRLGSLGTIPDEYDVAITTACGSLNDMVADTAQQGQACIEYLREQNVGRAGFIVLEEIDETDGMRSIRTPENVPRLFDLVEAKEPRFAHAFYEALRGESSLSQAVEWARNLPPMQVPPDVLRKYEQDSEVAAAQLTVAMEELRAAEAKLEAVGESGPQINLEIEKVSLDIQDAGKRVIEAEKRVHDLSQMQGDISRIASLEREIATARNQLEGLRSPSGTIEEAIKAIEREILDIGGSRLLAQKSQVDGLKLHIDAANEKITKAEVAMAKAERDLAKFEGSIASNRQSLAGVEIELGKLSESLREVRDYAARAEVENLKADSEGSKAELDGEERHATPS
ncbi:hypothetical protein EDB85DRAFT_2291656 [Lactarius pseudohatsudake]|nr:hypothetical protein EDB85DRAFT_2291656 [Lactarius pseudohatsudake]